MIAPSSLQPRHDRRVLLGLIAGEDVAAHLRRHVLGDRQVLDRRRNAVQPPDTLSASSARPRRASRHPLRHRPPDRRTRSPAGSAPRCVPAVAVISSTGESCLRRIISASSTAGVKASVSLSIRMPLFNMWPGRRRCRTRRQWRSCIPRSPASRPARRSHRSRRTGRAGSSTA